MFRVAANTANRGLSISSSFEISGLHVMSRRSLADAVFDRLEIAIKSGAYQDDDRLPSEHEMAAEFDVSRPVVREALRRLREKGLIYSRQGAGSFVRTLGVRSPLGYGPLENVADLMDFYEFRLTVEPAAAALAAERHDAELLDGIASAMGIMRYAASRQTQREDADFQFHMAVAAASGNSYFSTSISALREHIAAGVRFHNSSARREIEETGRDMEEHEQVFLAIQDRDADRAAEAMRAHLLSLRDRLFERRRSDPRPE
ncbi:DNA-binding transcriptional regulator, FadR family [Paracoccus alkenifer]|uniref:DNA-binding transcriptional regulator, FadR family n=2 Tax=Paracoccus alkenifer TaxID=65735 RepID=A0A1H6ND00_9RHOB|nr:DNA-binding transcriptional regulator, FadR family [Paracoccus alkenifer]